MLSVKTKFLLIVKVMHFSNPYGITHIFTSNLPILPLSNNCHRPFKLLNVTGTFFVDLILILQFAERLYFAVT